MDQYSAAAALQELYDLFPALQDDDDTSPPRTEDLLAMAAENQEIHDRIQRALDGGLGMLKEEGEDDLIDGRLEPHTVLLHFGRGGAARMTRTQMSEF